MYLDNIGAICRTLLPIGPVEEANKSSLMRTISLITFWKPISRRYAQYEYWMSASRFLCLTVEFTEGCQMLDDDELNNANAGVGIASTTSSLKINNYDDYQSGYAFGKRQLSYFAAKNPGSWGNNLKVCYIDDFRRSDYWYRNFLDS